MQPPTLLLLLLFLPKILSHNWMTQPPPYTPKTFNCDNPPCTNACPISTSPGPPLTTYQRGQTVRITWNRNNHHGGMYRLSLVPFNLRYHRPSHTRFTLKHGCWETGQHPCQPHEDCGTDQKRHAYSTVIQIPSVFPDGDYVMGYVWYGGLRYQRDFGQFSDYFSCAVVRIKGGRTLGGSYSAFFEPGEGSRIEGGMCRTSADRIGDCESGCPNKPSFAGIPRVFMEGGLPRITPRDVRRAARGTGIDENDQEQEEEEREEKEREEEREESGGSSDESVDRGICSGAVCCASQCGRCGGTGCHRLPGGGHSCCFNTIARSGRICSETMGAPCVKE